METGFPREAYRHFLFWGVLSSLGVTFSTLVDAYFVGNYIGSDGLACANIATPVFLLFAVLGISIGFGGSVGIGKNLGDADVATARHLFGVELFSGGAIGIAVAIIGVAFADFWIRLLGASGELIPLEKQYVTVVFASAPFFILYQILSSAVSADADPRRVSLAAFAVILTDAAGDFLFMKVFRMGILGASLSLCISIVAGDLILVTHFFSKKSLLTFIPRIPHKGELGKMLTGGFGVSSTLLFQSVMMIVFNLLLMNTRGGDRVLSVALFGVIYTVSTFSSAFSGGASNALASVVSIFVGERDKKGIMTVFRFALIFALVTGIGMAGLFFLFAEEILVFFGVTDAEFLPYAVSVFRLYAISIAFSGLSEVCVTFWQTIGREKLAGLMSVLRNLLMSFGVGCALIPFFGGTGVGISYLSGAIFGLLSAFAVFLFSHSGRFIDRFLPLAGKTFEEYYLLSPESVGEISEDIERLCDEWEIDPKRSMFLNLIAEEVILNIARLGAGENNRRYYISLKCTEENGTYRIRVRDNVRSYNPFELTGDDVDNAVMTMLIKKTKEHDYQRKLIFNYLYFAI